MSSTVTPRKAIAERVSPFDAALAALTTVELALRGRRPEALLRAIVLLEVAGREANPAARAGDLAMVQASLDEAIRELTAQRGTLEVDHRPSTVTLGTRRARVRNGPVELARFLVVLAFARTWVARAANVPGATVPKDGRGKRRRAR